MSHPVVHWEVGGPDAEALRAFYATAFGWTMSDAGPNYTLVEPVGDGIGGGIMQAPDGVPPYVTIYVRVPDLAAKLAEIEQLGGKVITPATPIGPDAAFALFADPEGAVVGLLQQSAPIGA